MLWLSMFILGLAIGFLLGGYVAYNIIKKIEKERK